MEETRSIITIIWIALCPLIMATITTLATFFAWLLYQIFPQFDAFAMSALALSHDFALEFLTFTVQFSLDHCDTIASARLMAICIVYFFVTGLVFWLAQALHATESIVKIASGIASWASACVWVRVATAALLTSLLAGPASTSALAYMRHHATHHINNLIAGCRSALESLASPVFQDYIDSQIYKCVQVVLSISNSPRSRAAIEYAVTEGRKVFHSTLKMLYGLKTPPISQWLALGSLVVVLAVIFLAVLLFRRHQSGGSDRRMTKTVHIITRLASGTVVYAVADIASFKSYRTDTLLRGYATIAALIRSSFEDEDRMLDDALGCFELALAGDDGNYRMLMVEVKSVDLVEV